MAERLPLDANVLGYWGFDETLAVDAAIDESGNGHHLTVEDSTSVVYGRVGNARQFNGTSTVAYPSNSAVFRLGNSLTIIGWFNLTQFNSSGSNSRTIVACDGPADVDGQLYAIYVDNLGRLVYRHEKSGVGEILVRSPSGSIKTGRPVHFSVVRTDVGGGNCTVDIYINNQQHQVTYLLEGVQTAFPAPLPTSSVVNTLKFGKSDRYSATDFARWEGWLDETSIHDVARLNHAYLISSYFRVTLTDSTSRITTSDSVHSLDTTNMGIGQRWWTYIKDNSVFVTREFPFGTFEPEVQLTASSSTSPGGVSLPDLVYEPSTDTLVVVFVNSGRIYRITANADDAPVTQQMPTTSDSGSIIKAVDQVDAVRVGDGHGAQDPMELAVYPTPSANGITFVSDPSFGIAIPADSSGLSEGFKIFELTGGSELDLGNATSPVFGRAFWFFPISTRSPGKRYIAKSIRANGALGTPSNVIQDDGGGLTTIFTESVIYFNANLDSPDFSQLGAGGGLEDNASSGALVYIGSSPVKAALLEPVAAEVGSGGGTELMPELYTQTNSSPVKAALLEPEALLVGSGAGWGLEVSGGSMVPPGMETN